jgi:hypothetical protein
MNRDFRKFFDCGSSFARWAPPLVCLIIALLLAGCKTNSSTPPKSNSGSQTPRGDQAAGATPTPRIPAFFATEDEAKPLPPVLDPTQFSDPVVAKAYRYAQANPGVFAQQPCYCYCDSGSNHRSLLDCFATDHSAG